jgi:hypothetical protein
MKEKETKVCGTCKVEKPIKEFARDNTKMSVYYQCRMCTVLANRAAKKKRKEGTIIAF